MGPEAAAGEAVVRVPCTYRARAWWGDQVLAESTETVRLETESAGPALYFPRNDVRVDLFTDEGHRRPCPVKGAARLWSIEGIPAHLTGQDWQDERRAGGSDGADVMWEFTDPRPGFEWLSGLAAFDHDRVRVELLDPGAGEDPRALSVKRFPTWGDASHLVDMMDVRAEGDGTFVSVTRASHRRPVVEGSQMLGQAIVAAGRHAPGRRVVGAQMVFMRGADAFKPLRFEIDEAGGGRTFSTLAVHVGQAGRRVATGILLLDTTAPDVVRHSAPAPVVPGPYDCPAHDMSVMGRDIRVVDGAYTDDPDAPVGPPVIDAWVRFADLPDDPCLHAGLLAQFTGHMSIAAALRPHAGIGQREAHRTLSTAPNAISLSLHADVRADGWMLYHHESTFAGDGMTHSACRVHDEEGRLLASFSVEAMVRRFQRDPAAVDDRTAM
jgi:acyl-CoA thioesterase/uncharacterized protein (DUF427 family)